MVVQDKLRHPGMLAAFAFYLYACLAGDSMYSIVYLLGITLRVTDPIMEWRLLLITDILTKVINPCITVSLLELAASEITVHGQEQRWQVCCRHDKLCSAVLARAPSAHRLAAVYVACHATFQRQQKGHLHGCQEHERNNSCVSSEHLRQDEIHAAGIEYFCHESG